MRHVKFQCILWLCMLAFASEALAQNVAGWPHFRNSPQQLGIATGTLPRKPELLWSWKIEGNQSIKSSPVTGNGMVYFGASDGRVYALNQTTGQLVWSIATGDAVEAPPMVVGKMLFIGSTDHFLYALDAIDGSMKWKYETGDKIMGSVNAMRDEKYLLRIFVGSYDNKLHCVDGDTGKSIWTYSTENYLNGSPAIEKEMVCIGGCDGNFHLVRAADGIGIAQIPVGAYIAGSAAVLDGKAYLGHYGNQYVCIDLAEKKVEWIFNGSQFPYFSSPAVINDRVIFGGRDRIVHAVNRADGKQIWEHATRGKVDGSPVICGENVVIGSTDGQLCILNLRDGAELWSYDLGKSVNTSPAVTAGRIYIGTDEGRLFCFGSKP